MEKVSIRGVELFPFESAGQVVDYVAKHNGILVAVNAEKVLHATPVTMGIINRNIGYCDGAGTLKALRMKGYDKACKIAGCDLWLDIVRSFYKERSFYLVGSTQEVIEKTVAKLRGDFPAINIVGFHNGYLNDDATREAVIADIVARRPGVVLVAMGSPRQELFMEAVQERYADAVFQGLGGSFDIYVGNVKRAPQWWLKHNLEWAYRLLDQPSRIKRQVYLLKFAWWLLAGKL